MICPLLQSPRLTNRKPRGFYLGGTKHGAGEKVPRQSRFGNWEETAPKLGPWKLFQIWKIGYDCDSYGERKKKDELRMDSQLVTSNQGWSLFQFRITIALHSKFYIPPLRSGVEETTKFVPCSPNTTATWNRKYWS